MTEVELAAHPLTAELAACGNLFHRWQWSLSSSSNYSALLSEGRVIISRSGVDKERMTSADFMLVDLEARPLPPFQAMKPSAETELHCHIYRHADRFAAKAVLHTHSKHSVYFSRRYADKGEIRFSGFEMQKIFEGVDTHDSAICLPVFPNSQKMADIVGNFDGYLAKGSTPPAYLIAGHGIYSWGKTILHAKQKLEAIEHLLEIRFMEENNAE